VHFSRPQLVLAARLVVSALAAVGPGDQDRGQLVRGHPRPHHRQRWPGSPGALLLTFGGVVLVGRALGVPCSNALGQHPPFRRLLSLYLAGQFMGNVLPSTIGGDALRVSRLSRDKRAKPPTTFASVVLERLTGWLVLPGDHPHRAGW
jgi:hypothetical protein